MSTTELFYIGALIFGGIGLIIDGLYGILKEDRKDPFNYIVLLFGCVFTALGLIRVFTL